MTPVDPSDLAGDAVLVAPSLLGKLLWSSREGSVTAGRIVEVEAYREDDPASHSFRGPTSRTQTMFGPPGRLYVYRSYGIHTLANVVCEAPGRGAAVLLRAIQPVVGTSRMRSARGLAPGAPEREIANGPGKLTQALEVTLDHYGQSLLRGRLSLRRPARSDPPAAVARSRRVGLSQGGALPYHFYVPGNEFVSRVRV